MSLKIFGQSFKKENCFNSRISDDIDRKLEPIIKLDKGKKTTRKKFDNEVISASRNAILIFSIYGQLTAIWKPDPGRIVCKT